MEDGARQQADVSAALLALLPGLELVIVRALGAGEDARDALQEVVARSLAVAARGDLPAGAEMAAYVYGIARHVITDEVRARVRASRADPLPDSLPAPHPHPLDSLIDAEQVDTLARALRQLDEDDRELLRRCYVDGEPIAALARALHEPAARLRKRKSRALQRLRALVERGRSHETAPPEPTSHDQATPLRHTPRPSPIS